MPSEAEVSALAASIYDEKYRAKVQAGADRGNAGWWVAGKQYRRRAEDEARAALASSAAEQSER